MPNLSYKAHDAQIAAWGDELTLGLLTAAPNPDGTGITEPASDDGYARRSITFDKVQADGVTTLTNEEALVFGAATADWTTVTYFGLFDSDDDLVVYGRLRTARTNPSGRAITFQAETIELRLR